MATNRWIGVSGDWSNPSDWSANAVPGPSDKAVIAAAGSYTVTVTTSESVGSVVLNDPGAILDIQPVLFHPATLAVSGSAVIKSGTLEIQGDGYFLRELGGVLAIGGSLKVESGGTLFLDGGTIEGGSLIIGKGGNLEVQSSVPSAGSTLQNVAVRGGLMLNSGTLVLAGDTTVENSSGTGPGAITLNGSQYSYLVFAENYTLSKLTLNGGSVAGIGATVTVGKGGLVEGHGEFIFGDFGYLALDNEGTINSNVNGQWLNIVEMPFVNDGLVKATNGGNISIDWNDAFAPADPWSNKAGAIISVTHGGTLQLGGNVTNDGLIKALHGTVYFGGDIPGPGLPYEPQNAGDISVFDSALFFGATNTGVITAVNSTVHFAPSEFSTHPLQNTGDIATIGGQLFLGEAGQNNLTPLQWTDSGLIATFGTAIDVEGNGDISAGGILSIRGGSVSGPASLQDDGQIKLHGASMDLSSLKIAPSGELSGFGTVVNAIENLGVIDARGGKMDLASAITGSGQFEISKAAILELGGPTAETVTFESKFGTLHLDTARDFSGTIAGMAKGDSVDLADFAFSSHPVITNVSGTGAAGTTTDVTITDGSLTTTLQLLNQYAGQYPVASKAYHLASDHSGSGSAGTLFTLASPRHDHDTFVFAPNLGEHAVANSTEHNEEFAPHMPEFAELTALLVQAQNDGANLPAHDASGIVHHAEALTAQQAHHFLV
jgi:fibronectin-binding autotransporter adhesin